MIDEAWYFAMDKAFRFDRLAKSASTIEDRVGFQVAAAGSRGIAAMYGAIAAACFSIISIAVGWSGLLYSIRGSDASPVTVKVEVNANDTEGVNELQSKQEANHQLSEFASNDDGSDGR